jgi:hypothetical protein
MIGRIFTNIAAIAGIAGLALTSSVAAQAQEFGSPELIAAAKAEGKLVFYTANFAEVEQQVIKAFNKRFPEIKVEMVRAPGGQLITRVKTEAAAGKLIADVVDHSDRALMQPIARVLDRRYQGTQTAYGIELFGRRLEVVELGTAARHQVGVETQVSLPKESCWAYRDTGPVAFE